MVNYSLNDKHSLHYKQDGELFRARVTDPLNDIVSGNYSGYAIVNKMGTNPLVDTTTTPEDIWEQSGIYTGWAASAQTLQLFSSSTDDTSAGTGLRTITIIGLNSDYEVITENVTLNGTTPVLTTQLFHRAHTMFGTSAGSGGVNVGVITARQSTTTTNIMVTIAVGRNQSNDSGYTIPAGYNGYLKTIHGAIRGNPADVNADGYIWARNFGGVFRSRRPFTINSRSRLIDDVYGGIAFPEKSDIIVRIGTVSTNNISIVCGYDLLLVSNTNG